MNQLMIKLIIKNLDKETKDKIKAEIEQKIEFLSNEVIADWFHISDYYKSPDEKKCVLSLTFQNGITIKDLLVLFDCCQWQYAISEVINEQDEVCEYERAIWSKLCNPNEIFVDPKVQWVHIYNWD